MKKFNIKEWQDKYLSESDDFVYSNKMTYFGYDVPRNAAKIKAGDYIIDVDDEYAIVKKVKGIAVYVKYVTGGSGAEMYDLASIIPTGAPSPLKSKRPKLKYKGKNVYYGLPLSHLALIDNIPTRVGLYLSKHDKEILKRRENGYLLKMDLKNKKFKT